MMRTIQRLKVADQRAFQLVCFATQPVPVAGAAVPFLPFRSAVLKGAKPQLRDWHDEKFRAPIPVSSSSNDRPLRPLPGDHEAAGFGEVHDVAI